MFLLPLMTVICYLIKIYDLSVYLVDSKHIACVTAYTNVSRVGILPSWCLIFQDFQEMLHHYFRWCWNFNSIRGLAYAETLWKGDPHVLMYIHTARSENPVKKKEQTYISSMGMWLSSFTLWASNLFSLFKFSCFCISSSDISLEE